AGAIPGHYTAVVQAGDGGFLGPVSAALAQTGQIPIGTMSLLFVATPPNGAGWQVSVGGQNIPGVEVSQVNSRFTEYAANISAFAGQIDDLRFTALAGLPMWKTCILGRFSFHPSLFPSRSNRLYLDLGASYWGCALSGVPSEILVFSAGKALSSIIAE